jgi:hypothetical protein
MRPQVLLLWVLVIISGSVRAQAPGDSTFSLLVNTSTSYSHASDPHINRWLKKYRYPGEPSLPANLNLEIAAIPVSSRIMYSLRISMILSTHNLSSMNLFGGVYDGIVKTRTILLFAGMGAGYHTDMITLNGEMPADYKVIATQYRRQLSLHRAGLFVEPAMRAFWYAIHYHNLRLGLFAGLGYDMNFNSHWKLGYYENRGGKYSHFKKIRNPADQQNVSEYGFSYSVGLSLQIIFH